MKPIVILLSGLLYGIIGFGAMGPTGSANVPCPHALDSAEADAAARQVASIIPEPAPVDEEEAKPVN